MPFLEGEEGVYAALAAAFGKHNLKWFVFGAQAAIFHGAARFTEDIDITVDLGDCDAHRLVESLARCGFSLRVADVDEFVARTRVLPIAFGDLPLDIAIAGPGIEEIFFEHVVQRQVGTTRVPVVSAEDLVVMKVLAGRAKDIEDVKAVLSANRGLDLDRTRDLLRALEHALDQSDLLDTLQKVVDEVDR